MKELLLRFFPDDSTTDFAWLIGILVGGWLARHLVASIVGRWLFRWLRRYSDGSHAALQEFSTLLRRPLENLFMLGIIYTAFDRVSFSNCFSLKVLNIINLCFDIVLQITLTWVLWRGVKYLTQLLLRQAARTESKTDDQLVPFFRDLTLVALVGLSGLVLVGKIFRIDIATLVAGLGVGGIAVALAARETLENLLASFTIFLDKPFALGDSIQVGTTSGDIEQIGFRSTRLRAADGSLLVMPNRLIISQMLENQTQRVFRRGKIILKLALSTPPEGITTVIQAVQKNIDDHPLLQTKKGNVRLETIADNAFEVSAIFFADNQDYHGFNAIKEEVLLQIIHILKENDVAFADFSGKVG